MPPTKMSMGRGAMVSCLGKMLHPRKEIIMRFPNMNKHKRFDNMILLREEKRIIAKKEQICYIMQSDDVMNDDEHVEVYACRRYVSIELEGPREGFFTNNIDIEDTERNDDITGEDTPFPEEVVERFHRTGLDDEDIVMLTGLIQVDNDSDPAPENIPRENNNNNECVFADQWGHSGICFRSCQLQPGHNHLPGLSSTLPSHPNLVDVFEQLFPKRFLVDVILVETNKHLKLGSLSYGEFLQWIGLWFLMATIQGPSRHDYWRQADVDCFAGAPYRFNMFMSRNRFDDIASAITYTSNNPPTTYVDKFWAIRDVVQAWNENMYQCFTPGWITCLDESMSTWTNKYTCPGFMFVPRKPWPFGNEWHTICCGLTGILFAVELVEGKDHPKERPPEDFENLGKTVGLLLRLTKKLWSTAKVVVLDSGFCVLKGIIELRKRGVFAAALIKKRRYWPKYIAGEEIKMHFDDKDVGYADSLHGTLEGIPFCIFGMKEPDYILMMMSTYGTLERIGNFTQRVVDRHQVTFKYPEVIRNHYLYRHMVDDHNSKRHAPISLEVTWATHTWTNRVFAFLLAITEVNVFLATKYFTQRQPTSMLEFRKAFSKELIYNRYIAQEQQEEHRRSRRTSRNLEHELTTLPKKRKFSVTRIVRANMDYQQFKCSGCPKRIRTYCRCTPGIFLCKECYAKHIAEQDIEFPMSVMNSDM
jgi:Transposase IS4